MALRFGVEIEAYGLTGNEIKEIVESAGGDFLGMFHYEGGSWNATRVGNGSSTCGRNPRSDSNGAWDSKIDGPIFKVNTDGSLNQRNATWDRTGSFEVVSPILHGEKGLAMLSKIMNRLEMAGAKVDSACGTHISIGVNQNARFNRFGTSKKMAMAREMVETYSHFQPVFDAISPNNRRSDDPRTYNATCNPNSPFNGRSNVNMIDAATFIQTGRIEFRQPGYTLSIKKITGWLRMLNALVSRTVNRDHVGYGLDPRNYPQTLEGFGNLCNPGVRAEKWAYNRIKDLADRLPQYRESRRAVLGGAY